MFEYVSTYMYVYVFVKIPKAPPTPKVLHNSGENLETAAERAK